MKKIIVSIVIALFFFTGCEKIHRYHYTGKWDFVVIYTSGSVDGWKSDTTYHLGKIRIGTTYNKLIIEYMKNTKINMYIDDDGALSKDFEEPHEFANGQFLGNNHVNISIGQVFLGGGYFYDIEGVKIMRGDSNE
jgi:hypothetical protein